MTRIVLLLTAIPLAAVLALVLNTLLDSRMAVLEASVRKAPRARMRRGLSIALALALSLAAFPAMADDTPSSCSSIDCSLLAEASTVDRLWRSASTDRISIVAQSRIPVAFDPALDSWDSPSEDVLAEEPAPSRPVETEFESPRPPAR